MKLRASNQSRQALTRVEVVVIIAVLVVLAAMLIPANIGSRRKAMRIACVNNLKQIGLAYRIWDCDNDAKYPMDVPVATGGSMEMGTSGKVTLTFLVLSNELNNPNILVCPEDTNRQPPAANFSWPLVGHISYFINLDASETDPQAPLSGDDNFEVGGIPVKPGLLVISSNTPIAWTTARHHLSGNLVLSDGSVQSLSNSGLTNWLHQADLGTNRLAIP